MPSIVGAMIHIKKNAVAWKVFKRIVKHLMLYYDGKEDALDECEDFEQEVADLKEEIKGLKRELEHIKNVDYGEE